MSDIESVRAELLRQKIIFDAELRRQREVYEGRLEAAEQGLRDRETDCRNLQSVITILGKKLDALQDHVMNNVQPRAGGAQTPRRLSSPSRSDAMQPSPYRRQPSPLLGSSHAVPVRRDGTPSLALFTGRAPSINGLHPATSSRASSPGRASVVSSVATRPKVNPSGSRVTTPRSGRQDLK